MAKFSLEFEGFDTMINTLKSLNGDVRKAAEKALIETHSHITSNLHSEMKRHFRTGRTEASIIDKADVTWNGDIASVQIGFDLENGGLASVFLMYGTPRRKPTPMKADKRLHNAIFGKSTAEEVAKIQSEIISEAITDALGD